MAGPLSVAVRACGNNRKYTRLHCDQVRTGKDPETQCRQEDSDGDIMYRLEDNDET